MELIERQDAIDAIKKCRNESDMPDMWYDGMSCALRCIYQLPSAQPKSYREGYQAGFKDAQLERKRGRWNCSDDMYESAVCSVCGWDTTEPWDHIRHWFNYCPNCGADMRGEQDDSF